MHFILSSVFALLNFSNLASARAVFAHFMVDNTGEFTQQKWLIEMQLAITANIDAFALNIASGRLFNDEQISNAFAAASSADFKLFFSFDYASEGAWDKAVVTALLQQYTSNAAYFHTTDTSQPLVSTFEGPASAADWIEIKASTGCFFIPDWSSLGANAALELEGGVADGLFNWAAWSQNGERMNTYIDASYLQYLGKKPYMMPASPWFYTNLPGFDKNWVWPDISMSLWSDRWTEILLQKPDYVEIISWNDYGESHYISQSSPSPPFLDGDDTFDYVTGIDHDAWTYPLAIWAEQYKTGKATVTEESLILEYMLHSPNDCNDGNTTVNTASQYQIESLPADIMTYKYIGFTATLGSMANVTIHVGDQVSAASWQTVPAGDVGVYHGSLLVTGTGTVSADLVRDGVTILTITGESIGGCGEDGYANFNPWVGGDFVPGKISVETPYELSDLVCVEGSGAPGFAEMCSVVCEYGYCPIGACYCTAIGLQKDYPVYTGDTGFATSDPDYNGLCAWTYQYGFTFPNHCSTTKQVTSVPTSSPFLPKACTAGERAVALDGLDELCAFTCSLGYCPIHLCSCTSEGALVSADDIDAPDIVTFTSNPDDRDQSALCDWACGTGGYCPCEIGTGTLPCDLSLNFTSMSALSDASGNYSTYCNSIYLLDVLYSNVTAELAEYNQENAGYDGLFGYYQTYIKDEIPSILISFMGWNISQEFSATAPGTKYFDCTYYDVHTKKNLTTQPCPGPRGGDNFEIYWTLINSTGFYADLQINYGIEADWVTLTDVDQSSCVSDDPLTVPCIPHHEIWHGYPQMASHVNVSNPKDLFTDAGPAMAALPLQIAATRLDVILGQWNGSTSDAVQSFAMPVALVSQAIQSMAEVKVLGKTEKEEEKKRLISLVLTAVLGVVPFVGEVGATLAGLAAIARTIAIAGEVANTAFTIYTIVEDPSSGPMSALGLLFGLGGVAAASRDAEGLSKVAALRREMKGEDVASMGVTVEDQAVLVQKIMKDCTL
ncbi:70f8fb62-2be9-40c0-91c7-3914c6610b41 [Sclerotinia trifoliorum]|uniref:70f8fb62-2be9-40c0-91c7-3914c6610b41 n=1 Tax=Sclerotinia trifoliorum TaxID=28548 RepID=A0A8H2VXP2_9HELO|nr:70f8fb62-2be9-40c0-91c7-3914c6610b41 [Sclerotinia trifoliorum]